MTQIAETTHHGQRVVLDEDVAGMRARVVEMGDLVERAISSSVTSLMRRDAAMAGRVIAEDRRVNDLHGEVRGLCIAAIVTQQPVARDLREIMGLLQMSAELERMGDHAVSIAKIAQVLVDVTELGAPVLPTLAQLCREQVHDIIAAVVAGDVDRARLVAARDDLVDCTYHDLFQELVQLMSGDGACVYRATQTVFAAHCLERIGDRVTNIAEDLVYLETGAIVELGSSPVSGIAEPRAR